MAISLDNMISIEKKLFICNLKTYNDREVEFLESIGMTADDTCSQWGCAYEIVNFRHRGNVNDTTKAELEEVVLQAGIDGCTIDIEYQENNYKSNIILGIA